MKTTDTVTKELKQIFGENVGGNVIEQGETITAKINVDGEITGAQLEQLSYSGDYKLKRSGTGITITLTCSVNGTPAEELKAAVTH